ncbi:MAG: DUF835 domain-containing protein [Candidatus Methanofastidiosia archaeon]
MDRFWRVALRSVERVLVAERGEIWHERTSASRKYMLWGIGGILFIIVLVSGCILRYSPAFVGCGLWVAAFVGSPFLNKKDTTSKSPSDTDVPLELGLGYVVYEKIPDMSIHLFQLHVDQGEKGLLVSRKFPEHTKSRHNLSNVEYVWLSTAEGENNWIDPCNLSKLHHVITDFIRNASVSIIFLEGFEYLMVRNSFLTALKFVQSIMDEVVLHQSHLILSINPDAFSKAELALIRRELVELDVD